MRGGGVHDRARSRDVVQGRTRRRACGRGLAGTSVLIGAGAVGPSKVACRRSTKDWEDKIAIGGKTKSEGAITRQPSTPSGEGGACFHVATGLIRVSRAVYSKPESKMRLN
jgi:hypothetical protein